MVATDTIDITLRPLEKGDVDWVHEIEIQTFTDPWPRHTFSELLGEEWSACFVALGGGNLVGYVCAVGRADELHIHNIAVCAACRGRGIGRRLLAEAETWARDRGKLCAILDVRESNGRARSLYESAGYVEVGRRRRCYDNPVEDALVLMKTLLDTPEEKV